MFAALNRPAEPTGPANHRREHDEPGAAAAATVAMPVPEEHEVQGNDEPSEHESEQEHGRAHARDQPPVACVASARHVRRLRFVAAHLASRLTPLHRSRRSGLRKTEGLARYILPDGRSRCTTARRSRRFQPRPPPARALPAAPGRTMLSTRSWAHRPARTGLGAPAWAHGPAHTGLRARAWAQGPVSPG